MSSGFKHDPLADISELAQVLRDQYDAASIPKELIQNADDADAKTLHFTWADGWPNHSHPLLRVPALVVLNDGRFTAQNAEAIRYLRLGSKGGDIGTIGKFGLGMKSVFHFTEAFLYFASPSQPAAGGQPFASWLNPWDGSQYHTDWGALEAHFGQVFGWLESWKHGCEPWFALWLPLRQREWGFPIVPEFRTLDEFFRPALGADIARAFPLLRSLEEACIWRGGARPTLDYGVRLATDRSRRLFPKINSGQQHAVSGRLALTDRTIVFAGQEVLLDDPSFSRMADEDWWPRVSTIDATVGATLVPDKAKPHAAAVFVSADKARPQAILRVSPAVFLPLGDADGVHPCTGRHDHDLYLHGCYFVDAGRRHLAPDNRWNTILRQKGALRQVLDALRNHVSGGPLDDPDIAGLTDALRTALVKDLGDVCHASMWLRRVKEPGPAWELCPRDSYYVVPSPPKDQEQLPFGVLPRLKSICDTHVVTFSEAPRLVPEPPMRWLTREGDWAHKILDVGIRDVFAKSETLRYFAAFTRSEREGTADILWTKAARPIAALLRGAIAQLGLQALAHLQEEVRSFAGLLTAELIVALPEPGADRQRHLDSLLEGLASVEVEHVLLPAALAPERTAGRLATIDAHKLLEWLAKQSETDRHWRSMRSELAVLLLHRTAGSLLEKRARCGDLTLFRVQSHKENKEALLTWNELDRHRVSRRLFSASPGGATALQQALRDEKLHSLIESRSDPRVADVLFGNTPPPQCSAAVCLSVLDERVVLAAPENRLQLVRFLRDELEKPQHRLVMRYLLHGEANDVTQGEPLLFSKKDIDTSDVWQRLLTGALTQTKQSWRVLPTVLTNELTPTASTALGIHAVGRQGVEQVLDKQDDLSWISELEFSSEDREEIISAVENDSLWRLLPLHRTTKGQLTSIADKRAYLDGGIAVPSVLAERIVLLEGSITPRLKAAYQSHHVEEWDAITAINESLVHEEPWKCAAVIMDALASLSKNDQAIPAATLPRLRQVKWVPTSNIAVAPADVVYLPEIAGTVEYLRLTPTIADAFVYAGDIANPIRTHEAFSTVATNLLPDRTTSCDLLSKALAQEAHFRLGVLSELAVASKSIRTLVSCFESVDESVFAARKVLTEVDVHYGSEALTRFSQPLRTQASLPLTLDRLRHLARRHSDTSVANRDEILDVHVAHVHELVTYEEFQPTTLKDLELLNRRGRWKSTSRLCLDAPGVNPSDLLHERHAAVLHNRLLGASAIAHRPTHLESLVRKELSPDLFRPYWREWDSVVPLEVVGGFVALLAADDPSVRGLAQEFLAHRDLDVFLSGLDRQSAFGTKVLAQECRFVFDVTDPQTQHTITTLNLLGESFDASIDTEYDNLLIDRPRQLVSPGKHPTFLLRFRQVDPTAHTREQLVRMLGETASVFLEAVEWAVIANIDEILNELAETEQLDLAVAQAMIAEMGFFYLKQLGGNSVPSLRPFVMRWDQLRYRREEEKIAAASGKKVIETADSEMQALRKDLQQALESTDAQHELLSLVRSRVRDHYQYTLESLPFELFQNADDAAVEMTQMVPASDAGSSHIVVEYDDVALRLAHWGRPINRFRVSGFSAEKGRARGFDRDLEKMLVLSASDKDMGLGEVTGKFGLGFKTVFLLSDSPEVVSDRLAFRVLGGMLPKALEPDRKQLLRQRLAHYGPTSGGTLVELPAGGAKPVEALGRFLSLVHITLAFAHAVRCCEIRHQNGNVERVSWEDRPVKESSEQVRIGLLRPTEGSGLGSATAVLLGRSSCQLLLILAEGGFKPLPAEVPTIWITAPTYECLDAGVALNARFAPDVGRARLAASPVNDEIAAIAGRELAEAFEALYVTAEGWLEHTRLGSSDNYAVWRSLWAVLTKGDLEATESQQARSVLRLALWHQGNGYAHLLAQGTVLPSGLSGPYRVLTSLQNTKFVIQGLLTEQAILASVMSWPFFAAFVQPGQALSADVTRTLRKFAPWAPTLQSVTLTQALKWEVRRNRQLSRDNAERLGLVVNPDLLTRVARDASLGESELPETLREFRFRASDGSWQDSSDLLIPYGNRRQDETRRAAFAPEERVAHKEYDAAGASDFIDACRGGLNAPSDLLAAWGIAADRLQAREAFLRYLLDGDLRAGVAGHVREQRHATWLDGLPTNPILKTFEEPEQLQLLGLLGFVRDDAAPGGGSPGPEPAPLRLSARTVLEWWRSEGSHHLTGYLERLYPNGQRLALGIGASREDWLKLFLLGMAQTLGWGSPQASRNFVDLCEREGLLSAFARAHEDAYAWVDRLDEYLGRQIQSVKYHVWLRLLIGLWLVGRGLDEYVAAIDSINRTPGAISPDLIFNPRTNPNLQGGGPDAPPIAPMLGIGCCFVLRELVATNVLTNPALHPYCYVPSAGVRWLVRALAGPDLDTVPGPRWVRSVAICDFLRKELGADGATFDGAFDIPLQLLAYNPDLLQRVLSLSAPPELDDDSRDEA